MDHGIMRYPDDEAVSRPLIISYSYSGHTEQIARAIRSVTGGDWCGIYPWQPYPMAFTELLDQVRKEIQTGYHPRLLPGFSSPKPYPVIFAGSPNWCGRVAPPLASWLAKNDLSGKTILPFYSHCGGVPCDFSREIARICPKAEVGRALGITGEEMADLPEMIREWLAENGLPTAAVPYAV